MSYTLWKASAFSSTFNFFCKRTKQRRKNKKSLQANARTANLTRHYFGQTEARTDNSTYKKLAVQWLNEALCFVSSFVVAESLVLRNRQLLVAANRCVQGAKKIRTQKIYETSDIQL